MTNLTTATFDQALTSSKPVVVDFWADWCMPCKMLAPVYEELAAELGDDIDFCKLDITENEKLAERYSVTHIPTIIVFREGKAVGRATGMLTKQKLKKMIIGV